MHLVNVRSLTNKIDSLLLHIQSDPDFRRSAALRNTETGLIDLIPDGAVQLPGFQPIQVNRSKEHPGKMKEGGVCCYINECLDQDVAV